MSIKGTKFEWFKQKQNLSEIYQSVEIKFALAGEDGDIVKQSHPWVKCRDFLHDALRSQITGTESYIYGFKFNPKIPSFPKISLNKTLLMVSQQTIDDVKVFRENLSRALPFIHYYENLAGVANSTLKKIPLTFCKDKQDFKHVWLFEGSLFWIAAPYMISMLTLLLRLGGKLPKVTAVDDPEKIYKTIVDKYETEWEKLVKEAKSFVKDNDIVYLQTCYNKLSNVVKLKDKLLSVHGTDELSKMYDSTIDIGSFHNLSGIFNACKGTTWNQEFNKIIKGINK